MIGRDSSVDRWTDRPIDNWIHSRACYMQMYMYLLNRGTCIHTYTHTRVDQPNTHIYVSEYVYIYMYWCIHTCAVYLLPYVNMAG